MRSAKPFWKVVAALALLGWVAPDVCAQAQKPAQAPAKQAETPTARPVVQRRDPFLPLVARGRPGGGDIPDNLPPGKAGLVVATVRLDGIVRSHNGMIAVVANPQNRVYFVREGDRLFNGSVERINMDSVTFRERGKDPFGNPLDRVVVKRLYPSAGEQR
jgi:hypothetical protein